MQAANVGIWIVYRKICYETLLADSLLARDATAAEPLLPACELH